ncbi:MAG TPA: DUF6221 family protein [Kribbella sp.]
MTEPVDHVGTSGKPHPLTRCRPDFCGQQPPSGTWGAPVLPSGLDQFTADQQPNPRPVDDLSEFVMDRIRFAESEPAADMVPKFYSRPGGAMTHRYAANVRADMAAFRRIVARYCEALSEWENCDNQAGRHDRGLLSAGLAEAVRSLAMRWADHPDFRDEWRLE